MSDRRRNIFILLLVLGLLAASLAVIVSAEADEARPGPPGRRPARLPGQADHAAADGHAEALERVAGHHARARRRSSASPSPSCSARPGPDRGRPPRRRRTPSARPSQVGTTAQLYFYDWEANILDENCRTNPDASVNGGQTAITGLYNAVKRASKCEPQVDRNNRRRRPRLLRLRQGLEAAAQRRQPRREERGARDLADRASSSTAEILEVPEGVVVVRNEKRERPSSRTPTAGGCSRDNPALSAPTSGTPSRTSTSRAATSRSSRSSSRTRAAGVPEDHERDRPRGADNALPTAAPEARVAALRDRARQRARLGAVHQLPGEPRRHRRLHRRPDLGRLHDPVRPGPRGDPPDRCAADAARADLALAGVRLARPAGARPGSNRRPRRLRRSSRST